MNVLQGFKTIIFNIVAIAASLLATNYEIELSPDHQAAITTTMIAVVNIGLRIITKTPVGKKKR